MARPTGKDVLRGILFVVLGILWVPVGIAAIILLLVPFALVGAAVLAYLHTEDYPRAATAVAALATMGWGYGWGWSKLRNGRRWQDFRMDF